MTTPITLDTLKTILGLVALAFAVFFFMDDRHSHPEHLEYTDANLRERILMSESTRYAEIQKYYIDKLKGEEKLTDAEQARLDLVQRQQKRIQAVLLKD